MPRRSEMIEINQMEYVFGERGGKGSLPSTFFRRVANSSQHHGPTEADAQQVVIGAGHSHAEHIIETKKSSKRKKQRSKKSHTAQFGHTGSKAYFDLDDDWDANIEQTSLKVSPLLGNDIKPEEYTARVECDEMNSRISRIMRFKAILDAPTLDLDQLKRLSWSGVPADLRPRVWMQLLGYLPTNSLRRDTILAKKRKEYRDDLDQVFSSVKDQQMWHQISIDVPRTNPHIKLYTFDTTQRSLERILYLWAMRHPASGYVQGISDLVTPFYQTFLNYYIGQRKIEELDPSTLDPEIISNVEADAYWCLSRLLDGIQDNYIHAQPGIHRQVEMLETLCRRVDSKLVDHLKEEGVEFMQFSFRWMNCLLMREVPMGCTIRMWDTYLTEGTHGFSEFHVYVCAAFLMRWAKELKNMDFQDLLIFLQRPPTDKWTEKEIELVLSEAFMFQSLFKNALSRENT